MSPRDLAQLCTHLHSQPELPLYQFLDRRLAVCETLRAGELLWRCRNLAARWQARYRPGETLLLISEQRADFVLALHACLMAGLVPVTVAPPGRQGEEDWVEQVVDLAPVAIACSQTMSVRLGKLLPGLHRHQVYPESERSPISAWRAPVPDPDSLALIQLSSGTTARPRPVRLSHRNVLSNLAEISAGMQTRGSDVALSWLPFHHDMGLIGHVLSPAHIGCRSVFMPSAVFAARPLRWLEAISRYRVTVSGAPDFALRLCIEAWQRDGLPQLDLSAWRVCYTGAERIVPETLRCFQATLESSGLRAEQLFPCYGLAESTLYVCGRFGLRTAQFQGIEYVSVGAPAPGVEMCLSDEEASGELMIRSVSISHDALRAQRSADARLRSGDLACLQDGEWFILGRLPERIKLRGALFHAGGLEQLLQARLLAQGLLHVICLPLPVDSRESLLVMIETRLSAEHAADLLRAAEAVLLRSAGLQAGLLCAFRPGSLARTSSGKIRRERCRQQFLRGELRERAILALDRECVADAG